MAKHAAVVLALSALLQIAASLAATGDDARQDHGAVFELGFDEEREISERISHLGPAVGIEIEPVENWLEIELGAATYRNQGVRSWELELPFKKPFRLSSTIEIMPGLGPTWTSAARLGGRATSWGAEAVIDLFFWRTRRKGWYLEPSYGIELGGGNAKSAALSGGIFFSLP
jgi:hypothetical protein